MIEPEQVAAQPGGPLLRHPIIRRPHEKPAPRPLFRHVRQGDGREDFLIPAHQRATAFVRKRLGAMTTDVGCNRPREREPPIDHSAVQNESLKYRSAPSGKMVTMTPLSRRLATSITAVSAAPDETPARSPSSRAS